MRKLYGEFGYIDFVAEPGFEPDLKNGIVDLSLSVAKASSSLCAASISRETSLGATR